jgi:DNA topoisomerase I
VKHGKINATLPKNMSIESVTLEVALKLIAEKASAPKKSR